MPPLGGMVCAPLKNVLLEGVRSAEPPRNSGIGGPITFSMASEEARVAWAALCLAAASYTCFLVSAQLAGSSPRMRRSNSRAASGNLAA